MAILLDGRKVAEDLKEELKKEASVLKKSRDLSPLLAVVCVGDNPAGQVYMKSQAKVAEELGLVHKILSYPAAISQKDLLAHIHKLNDDRSVTAVMVQTPLPPHLNFQEVVNTLSPDKDAEGLHPGNLGRLLLGEKTVVPCTAAACMVLLKNYRIKLYGKEVVIVGHSSIVGKPLSLLLLDELATTTVCHIATSEADRLKEHVRRAEVLVVAVGKAEFVKGDWIKEGAAVIDVGINRVGGRIVGDVEFDAAQKRAGFLTPVPGGVGPLTVVMLMRNCLTLAQHIGE